jgi:hypothetical protein
VRNLSSLGSFCRFLAILRAFFRADPSYGDGKPESSSEPRAHT